MYENFRELENGSKNLAVRVSRRKFKGGMPTSAHRLKAELVRKAPAMNRIAELWMVSRIASWEGGARPKIEDRTD